MSVLNAVTRRFALVLLLLLPSCIDAAGPSRPGPLVEVYERGSPLVPIYFPAPAFNDADNESIAPITALHLSQMDEKSLSGDGVEYAVRVLWMSFAFAGDAMVRIEKRRGGQVVSTFKRVPAGRDPGSIANTATVTAMKPVSETDFLRLTKQIRESYFFVLSNFEQALVTGGYLSIIEAYDGSQYHVAYCYLDDKPAITDIANLAAEIAGITRSDLPIAPRPSN